MTTRTKLASRSPATARSAMCQLVDINVVTAGLLYAWITVLGSANGDRVVASTDAQPAGSPPRVAPVRKVVRRAGVVTIPLKLNAAAKRLLKKNKQLSLGLRLSFTRKGGRQVTRTQRVTITAPQRLSVKCRALLTLPPKRPPKTFPRCVAK